MSIYDPTAGSGGMLLQSYQYVEENSGAPDNIELFGQENDPLVVGICKISIILHNVRNSNIRYGDTLADPQHFDKDRYLHAFDWVIAAV